MRVIVNISSQQLSVLDAQQKLLAQFSISSAKNGVGQLKNTGCTPLGKHIIRAKIGADAPVNAVFVARRWTGEIYSPALQQAHPERDWILTRILWLSGCEVGFNRLGQVDTMQRFIYIHGCPDSEPMVMPLSHGCIRMRNQDVMKLFDMVLVGTQVDIVLDSSQQAK